MNGRMYDPMVGRFLSADPVLQAPGNFQNYNRYSYCLNNPMKYTAPTGYQVYNYGTTWSSNLRTDVSGGGSSSRMGSELGTIYNSNGEINYRDPYSQEVLGAYYESDAERLSDFIVGRYYKKYVEGVDKSYIVMNNTLYSIEHVSLGVTLVSLDVASNGGDGYSVWQNAAEKSGYASSTLGGFGNIVYSEYKGVERWVGKNGNYYNSAKVRMNGGYARSAQLAKSASMTYKIAGHSMTALSVGFTAVEFAYSDKSGGDYARLVSAGIGVGLGFVPVVGPGLAIIYGIADSEGAFDGIYDYFDQ